uniref:Uncharacterized protein n=1 Tax=Kalanchoe fedtschenkoi TaxID=63787 RepID=A0A7N0R8P6_KALFE
MTSESGTHSPLDSTATDDSQNPRFEPLRLPTPEEIRGQDIWNNCAVRSVVSGVMGGPKAACVGCAGFATFSVLIEKFLDRHN